MKQGNRLSTPLSFALALCVALASGGAGAADAAPAWQEQLDLGRQAYKQNDKKSAKQHFLSALSEAQKAAGYGSKLGVMQAQCELTVLAFEDSVTGHPENAEEIYKALVSSGETTYGMDSPEIVDFLHCLGQTMVLQMKFDQAEAQYQRALHIAEQHLPPDDSKFVSLKKSVTALEQLKAATDAARKAGVPVTGL